MEFHTTELNTEEHS